MIPRIDPVYYYGRFIWHLSFPIVRIVDKLTELQSHREGGNATSESAEVVALSEVPRESVDAR